MSQILVKTYCLISVSIDSWQKKKATTVNKTLCPILQACEYACQLGYISHQLNASLQDLYMKEEDRLDEEERNIKYLTEERLAELVSVYNNVEQPRR